VIILSCNNISLSFGTNTILENITFNIHEKDKMGLVGVNGAGKSTLFKIISGILQADSGDISISKGYKIGYLQQDSGLDSDNTVWDELMLTYSSMIEMEKRIKQLEKAISTENSETILSSFMKEYSNLTEKYARAGGFEYNSMARGVLKGLGFDESQFELKIKALSGGQKTRLALAKLLLEEPDILLLDEPTNHLDISALEWLENFLKNYRKSVFLISHDRYFLDMVTNKTLELENRICKMFNGNYSEYVRLKSVEREVRQKHYEMQQKEISRLEAFIEQQRRWNREKNIIAAESRQKAIDRIERIEKPKELPGKIKLKFKSSISSGNDILFVEGLSKEYPGKPLFSNVSFNVRKDERVFLLGPNGCGKSTLLKILTGKLLQSSGNAEYGHNVVVGYYDQELDELDERNTVIEEVWNDNEKLTQTQLRNTLASFLFTGEDVFKPISVLSGGEKSRVALVKLMLSGSNFLILDEPTNHLDINSREVLEAALQNFEGTILVVSHDRYFINKLATRVLEMDANYFIDCPGDYSYFIDYKERMKKGADSSEGEKKPSLSKLQHMETKEERAKQRKLEKQLNETEQEIAQTEARLTEIRSEMLKEEVATDHIRLLEFDNERAALEKRLEELYKLWEILSAD
jgi:ATP-binding cassette subfamily F protein 3